MRCGFSSGVVSHCSIKVRHNQSMGVDLIWKLKAEALDTIFYSIGPMPSINYQVLMELCDLVAEYLL